MRPSVTVACVTSAAAPTSRRAGSTTPGERKPRIPIAAVRVTRAWSSARPVSWTASKCRPVRKSRCGWRAESCDDTRQVLPTPDSAAYGASGRREIRRRSLETRSRHSRRAESGVQPVALRLLHGASGCPEGDRWLGQDARPAATPHSQPDPGLIRKTCPRGCHANGPPRATSALRAGRTCSVPEAHMAATSTIHGESGGQDHGGLNTFMNT